MTPIVPSLVVADALLFADLPREELLDIASSSSSSVCWTDALVLATPYWDLPKGRLVEWLDLAAQIPPLTAASIRFDTDRGIKVFEVDPATVHPANTDLLHVLRRLEVGDVEDVSPLLEMMPSLTSLAVHSVCDLEDLGGFSALTSLQTLDLSGCDELVDVDGLGSLTWLQALELSNCRELLDVSDLSSMTSLQTLNLSGCDELVNVDCLGSLTSLRSLNLSWCGQLINLRGLGTLTSLQTLKLSGCDQLAHVDELGSLTSLRTLDLTGCDELGDLSALASLTSLHLIR